MRGKLVFRQSTEESIDTITKASRLSHKYMTSIKMKLNFCKNFILISSASQTENQIVFFIYIYTFCVLYLFGYWTHVLFLYKCDCLQVWLVWHTKHAKLVLYEGSAYNCAIKAWKLGPVFHGNRHEKAEACSSCQKVCETHQILHKSTWIIFI